MKTLTTAPLAKEVRVAVKKDLATLLDVRAEIKDIIAEAQERLKTIDTELYKRLEKTPERKLTADTHIVQIVERLSFTNVPLDVAKKYKAIKKVPNAKVLKPLYQKGYKMEGVTISEYIYVK
jgi:hypothetical protein